MPRSAHRHAVMALFTAAIVLSSTGAAAQASHEELRQWAKEAYEATQTGDFARAVEIYERLWAEKATYDVAMNLGIALSEIDRDAEAAEYLHIAVRDYPPSDSEESRLRLIERRDQVLARVGALTVRAPAGASVIVNGREAGTAPLRDPVFVEPGTVTLEAKRAGASSTPQSVQIGAGETQAITLDVLEPSTAPVANPSERPTWPLYALGGAAVAGLGVGIVGTVVGGSQLSDAENTPCPQGACANADEIQSDIDSANGLRTVGAVGFVVGGAAAVAWLTYFFWPEGDPSTTTGAAPATISVAPAWDPHGGGAHLHVRF